MFDSEIWLAYQKKKQFELLCLWTSSALPSIPTIRQIYLKNVNEPTVLAFAGKN